MEHDLQIALDLFQEESLGLVIVKEGQVLYSGVEQRLLPLFKALEGLGERAWGSSVADKVIGRAAAMLLVCAEVKSCYSPLGSQGALEILQSNHIPAHFEEVVPQILDTSGLRTCPMERLVDGITDPAEGRLKLCQFFQEHQLI
ncbi:MAG: DUF1893 domain-containing protein [Firmicutes bacterium]|jgi:hypothetical protein|nr:DUF1893 domain-containing protein [Bacillota bacterium]